MITPIQNNINIDPIKIPKKTQSFQGIAKYGKNIADTFTKTVETAKTSKILGGAKQYLAKGFDVIKGGLTAAKDFVVKYAKKAFEFVSKKIGDFKDISKNAGNKGKTIRNTIIAGTTAGSIFGAGGFAIHKRKGKESKE